MQLKFFHTLKIIPLTMTGKPCSSINFLISELCSIGLSVPGTTGTPAAIAIALASTYKQFKQNSIIICNYIWTLSPILCTISGGGPINVIPLSTQAWAKSARSERKPYPGWMASTFCSFFRVTLIYELEK